MTTQGRCSLAGFRCVPEWMFIALCRKICSTHERWWLIGESKKLLSLQPPDLILPLQLQHGGERFLHIPELLFWNENLMAFRKLNSYSPPMPSLPSHYSALYQNCPVKAQLHQTTDSHLWTHPICKHEECLCFLSTPACSCILQCLVNKAPCNPEYTLGWCSTHCPVWWKDFSECQINSS